MPLWPPGLIPVGDSCISGSREGQGHLATSVCSTAGPPLRALSSGSSGTESQGEVGGAPAPSSQNSSVLVALPLRPLGVTSQTHLPLAVQPALVSPYPYLPPPLAPCEGYEVLVAFTTDSSPGGDLLDPKACLCPFKCSAHIRVTTAMLDLDIYLLFSSSHEC